MSNSPPTQRREDAHNWPALLIIIFLGFIALISIIAIAWLLYEDKKVEAAFYGLPVAAITGLTTLLANLGKPANSGSVGDRARDTPATAKEIGESVVNAAVAADGLPVKAADPDGSQTASEEATEEEPTR